MTTRNDPDNRLSDQVITSQANELVRRVRALGLRKHRDREGAFVVEGIRPVWQAVESGAALDALIVAPDLLASDAAMRMVEQQRAGGARVVAVSSAVFERFAEREHPSGLAAIVRRKRHCLADLAVTPHALFAALYQPGNPGNVGTILRTLDAVAGGGLIVIGASADPYHPTAVKASMGAVFRVPVVHLDEAGDLCTWCHDAGLHLVTTSEHSQHVHWSAPIPLPAVLLFGSEGEGLLPELLESGDVDVRIPMAGAAGSLNVAVAAGILLYEARRPQWGKALE